MFDEVVLTRHITENYTDFVGDTLVEKKPVPNWTKLLGEQAAELINKKGREKTLKVLVVYGGVSNKKNNKSKKQGMGHLAIPLYKLLLQHQSIYIYL